MAFIVRGLEIYSLDVRHGAKRSIFRVMSDDQVQFVRIHFSLLAVLLFRRPGKRLVRAGYVHSSTKPIKRDSLECRDMENPGAKRQDSVHMI